MLLLGIETTFGFNSFRYFFTRFFNTTILDLSIFGSLHGCITSFQVFPFKLILFEVVFIVGAQFWKEIYFLSTCEILINRSIRADPLQFLSQLFRLSNLVIGAPIDPKTRFLLQNIECLLSLHEHLILNTSQKLQTSMNPRFPFPLSQPRMMGMLLS